MSPAPLRFARLSRSLPTGIVAALAWIAAAAAGVVFWGCEKPPSQAATAAAPTSVSTAPVRRLEMPRLVEVTGSLRALEDVTVSAKVSGRVLSLAADLGDARKSGELLVQIDPRDAELALGEREAQLAATLAKLGLSTVPASDIDYSSLPAVQRAQAEAANAQARFDRARRLHEQQPPLIADQDFADVRTQWEVAAKAVESEILAAKATLAEARALVASTESARQVLKDTRVEVPSFGPGGPNEFRVAARLVSIGELVGPGQSLFRLVATQQVKFRGSVPERFAGSVAAGQAAGVSIAGFEAPFPGTVTRISPAINPATRSFEVEVLADNPRGELKPGAFARTTITVRAEPGVVCVPAAAIVEFAGVQRVFTVKEGKASALVVRTGQRLGDAVELLNITNAPEAVILQPGNLRDGAPVTVSAN